jgi:hypothetical protein
VRDFVVVDAARQRKASVAQERKRGNRAKGTEAALTGVPTFSPQL